MSEWIHEYFEHGYAKRWTLGLSSPALKREAAAVCELLGIRGGLPLLDVGCGHGRFALSLAAHGVHVIGLDLAGNLLERARQLGVDDGVKISWLRGDMRCLPLRDGSIGGAVLIDAFGFFESEAENEQTLHEVARALVAGGRIFMRVVNAEPIIVSFRENDREEHDEVVVEISRSLERAPTRLIERLAITGPKGRETYMRRQRLYRITELSEVVTKAGLRVVNILGSASREPFDLNKSPRIVLVGERSSTAA